MKNHQICYGPWHPWSLPFAQTPQNCSNHPEEQGPTIHSPEPDAKKFILGNKMKMKIKITIIRQDVKEKQDNEWMNKKRGREKMKIQILLMEISHPARPFPFHAFEIKSWIV